MYKNHNCLEHSLGVIVLLFLFFILVFCPEHNTKTIRGINLKLYYWIELDEKRCSVQEP